MKIALIVPGGVDRSGTRRVIPVLLALIRRVARRHETHVFSMRGSEAPERYLLEGATVHQVGARGRATIATARAVLAEHRRGGFGLLHAFWASGPGVAAALAAPLIRRPVLLHVTGGDLAALPGIGYGARLTVAGRARVRLALAAAAHVTAPSRGVCDAAAALGYPAERLPLGVDPDVWAIEGERRPAGDGGERAARLLHVASLNPVKDQATLLRAARRLADAGVDYALDIVGEDTLDGRVQHMAETLSLNGRVRFHGWLPTDRLRPLMAAADALLMSSLHEADPVVVLEAAMAGVPTVGTRVGHIRDWAPEAAVAVEPGDAEALARETAALLNDEDRRRTIAAAARARALREDADWSAARVLETYDRITRT